jgi:hypothetical protein
MIDPAEWRVASSLEKLAEMVREMSLAGRVVDADLAWSGGTAELLAALETVRSPARGPVAAAPDAPRPDPPSAGSDLSPYPDITLVRAGDRAFLFSDQHMTRSYAEAAARSAAGDIRGLIAETVRQDSATYPRPTPVAVFSGPPFRLSAEQIASVVESLSGDADYPDVRVVHASDGSVFLFSSTHLKPAQAESLAEWIAVRQFENP